MLLGYILFILPPVAVLAALVYLPFWLLQRRRGVRLPWWVHLARYALAGCVFSLLYLTIFWAIDENTFPVMYHFYNLRPFVWLTEVYEMGAAKMLRQLALNVLMFVPLGLLLPASFQRMRRFEATAGVVLATTLLIEIAQYFIGRSADVDDVIMNFLGGVIGFGLFGALDKLRRRGGKK